MKNQWFLLRQQRQRHLHDLEHLVYQGKYPRGIQAVHVCKRIKDKICIYWGGRSFSIGICACIICGSGGYNCCIGDTIGGGCSACICSRSWSSIPKSWKKKKRSGDFGVLNNYRLKKKFLLKKDSWKYFFNGSEWHCAKTKKNFKKRKFLVGCIWAQMKVPKKAKVLNTVFWFVFFSLNFITGKNCGWA